MTRKTGNVSQIDDYQISKLAADKLASSGLTLDDAKALGISWLTPTQTTMYLGPKFENNTVGSLKFDYFNVDCSPMLGRPAGDPYFRLRALNPPQVKEAGSTKGAFGSDPTAKKGKGPWRYIQQARTLPHAYFPLQVRHEVEQEDKTINLEATDWSELAGRPEIPLIITEGELKAAKACKEGFPTIGLGGVHSWRSNPHGLMWLPELSGKDSILWGGRKVYICFDSDVRQKPDVANALKGLSDELNNLGAFVHMISLPAADNEKVGLDDFFVSDPHANETLRFLQAQAQPLGFAQPLFNLNKRYVWVRSPSMILDMKTRSELSSTEFKENEGIMETRVINIKATGALDYKIVSVAAEWIKWPLRLSVDRLTYLPGQPTFIGECEEYNTWAGWGCSPKEGDVSLFLDLLDTMFTGAEPGAREWMIQWLAYPLQHPGTKLSQCIGIHSVDTGTGKSSIGYTMREIYGRNFHEIGQKTIHDTFNQWTVDKQFIMIDDITGTDNRAEADVFKKMITQETLMVNSKHVKQYEMPDCINYILTSNRPNAFFLEDEDRRFFIHEVMVKKSEDYYDAYRKWVATLDGKSAVFHYLLNVDLKGFNPKGHAFKTRARGAMIENVRSELATWVHELKENPDFILREGGASLKADMFTNKYLLQLYEGWRKSDRTSSTTPNGLGRALSEAKFRQALDGLTVHTKDGDKQRYYIVRNHEKWRTADRQAVTDHLNQHLR